MAGVWPKLGCHSGGAGNSEHGQASSLPTAGNDRGEAGFLGQDGGRCGAKTIGCQSLDSVAEGIHTSERGGVRGEEIGPVGENREEEAMGNPMAKEGSDARPGGGG